VRGIVREVQAVDVAEFDDTSAQPCERSVAVFGGATAYGFGADPLVEPSEAGMLKLFQIGHDGFPFLGPMLRPVPRGKATGRGKSRRSRLRRRRWRSVPLAVAWSVVERYRLLRRLLEH